VNKVLTGNQPEMANYEFLIGVDDLKQGLDRHSVTVVDCRFDLMQPAKGRDEYQQGHIPGARYADLDKDLAGPVTESTGRHPLPPPQDFAKTLGAWGIGNETQVVVYDHGSGAIAARLWWMLKWLGHDSVAVLDGGYAAWQHAGYPLSDKEEIITSRTFQPSPDEALTVSTSELVASMQSGDAVRIVDARDPARFAGMREPIDSVAGHVPGALNHPFSAAINTEGGWKSASELRDGWEGILGGNTRQAWVAMCGSGVTACHLALSARVAGYPQPRLYVGSWSEWIRDPGRPIAADIR